MYSNILKKEIAHTKITYKSYNLIVHCIFTRKMTEVQVKSDSQGRTHHHGSQEKVREALYL